MRPITFLSDYGDADEFVGVCHGVIASLAPDVRILDITHGVARHDVRAAAGEACDPAGFEVIELPRSRLDGEALVAAVSSDRFGNIALDATARQLWPLALPGGGPCEIEIGDRRWRAWLAVAFADVPEGEVLVYEDAYRTLAVAVNRGSAAERLAVAPDDELRIRPT